MDALCRSLTQAEELGLYFRKILGYNFYMTTTADIIELERAIREECEQSGKDYEAFLTANLKGMLAELRFQRDCKEIQSDVKASGMPAGDDYLEQNS